jgi:hypothetical protein
LGQVYQPLSPVWFHDLSPADFSRHHRNQVWSVNWLVAATDLPPKPKVLEVR